MMKRLSKIALLAAAAFMLAGFPACSGDDEDEEEGGNLPTVERKITLYKNGESQGEKASVAEALKAVSTTGTDVWEIKLTKGTYTESEQLTYNGSATVKITGETDTAYGSDVIIKGIGSDYTQEKYRSMFEIYGTGDTVLKNVTMEHADKMALANTEKTQREVIGHESKGTLAAYNCSFISRQDTIRTESKAWFYKCYIEGDVDFLWIEQSTKASKAALYEECELYAVGDRTKKAYFTAPRLPVKNEVGKGLVIWKSSLRADDRLSEVYLGRNPWDEATDSEKGTSYFNDYYENVAVVDSGWSGKTLDSKVWSGSGAHGTENQQFVGFKTCQKFAAPSPNDCGAAVLTPEQVAAEYSNRNYILNRVYNIEKAHFENDYPIWNLSALETEFGAERSSALPVSPTTIEWNQSTNFTKDSDVLFDKGGFKEHNNGQLLNGGNNAQLSFYVVDNCEIEVLLNYAGEIKIECGNQTTTGSKSTTNPVKLSLNNIVNPSKVLVTATLNGSTYIESVKVKYVRNVDNELEALRTTLAANSTYDFTTWADYQSSKQNDQIEKSKPADVGTGAAISFTSVKWHGNQYGLTGGDGAFR